METSDDQFVSLVQKCMGLLIGLSILMICLHSVERWFEYVFPESDVVQAFPGGKLTSVPDDPPVYVGDESGTRAVLVPPEVYEFSFLAGPFYKFALAGFLFLGLFFGLRGVWSKTVSPERGDGD